MMFLLVSTIIAAAISCTSATPVVTAVPIAGGCEAYPNYDNNTQMAFPLLAKVTNSDNPAIEGFFDTDDVSIGVGSRGPILRWGYLTFPANNSVPKVVLRCSNNTLQAYTRSSFNGASFGITWESLTLTDLPYQDFMFHPARGAPITLFAHYINGTKQNGVYLGGYDNSTSWGLQRENGTVYSGWVDYFTARLLGPKSADPSTGKPLFPNEFTAFVQIVAA